MAAVGFPPDFRFKDGRPQGRAEPRGNREVPQAPAGGWAGGSPARSHHSQPRGCSALPEPGSEQGARRNDSAQGAQGLWPRKPQPLGLLRRLQPVPLCVQQGFVGNLFVEMVQGHSELRGVPEGLRPGAPLVPSPASRWVWGSLRRRCLTLLDPPVVLGVPGSAQPSVGPRAPRVHLPPSTFAAEEAPEPPIRTSWELPA